MLRSVIPSLQPEDYCELCLEISDEGVDEGGGDGDAEPPHHHVREFPELHKIR